MTEEPKKPPRTVIIEIEFMGANGDTMAEMGLDEDLDAKGVIAQMKHDAASSSGKMVTRMLESWEMLNYPSISVEVMDEDGNTTRADWSPT